VRVANEVIEVQSNVISSRGEDGHVKLGSCTGLPSGKRTDMLTYAMIERSLDRQND
jgi:hypothetical protein